MSLYKNCGWWKNCDCIFEFSVKSYVTNTIKLSFAKILLPSVIKICNLFDLFWCVGHIKGRKNNNLWVYLVISVLLYAF